MLNKSIQELADDISTKYSDLDDIVLAIQKAIFDHAKELPATYKPKDIIESRFTASQIAFDKGMISCGAVTNISAEMLRHLGYKVKLIHGECSESVDHAWISVFDDQSQSWVEFDLTREDMRVPSTHITKDIVDSWEEIREKIEEDQKTLLERRQKKDI